MGVLHFALVSCLVRQKP